MQRGTWVRLNPSGFKEKGGNYTTASTVVLRRSAIRRWKLDWGARSDEHQGNPLKQLGEVRILTKATAGREEEEALVVAE